MTQFPTSSFSHLKFDDLLDATTTEEAAEGPLCVPNDRVEELEWYPNFIDGSIKVENLPSTAEHDNEKGDSNLTGAVSDDHRVLKKRRRNRFGRRVWSMEPPTCLSNPSQEGGGEENKESGDELSWTPRVCRRCMAEETPQWRGGPGGPGTLCNACGIRYKAGRLLPEYRPMASPTFLNDRYSNSHRKVMKIRKVKDTNVE